MKKIIIINTLVLASLIAYLVRLSFMDNNPGFFWRAIIGAIIITLIIGLLMYKHLNFNSKSIAAIGGVINVFMFLLVVSATLPIDGIWCLSHGKPLINPKSCGGGVNYQSLWAGLFGVHHDYTPSEEGLCKFHYQYIPHDNICRRAQLGFYQYIDSVGNPYFDSKTLIFNLGWILFPLGSLVSYLYLLRKPVKKPPK